jgi:hypothetical protein
VSRGGAVDVGVLVAIGAEASGLPTSITVPLLPREADSPPHAVNGATVATAAYICARDHPAGMDAEIAVPSIGDAQNGQRVSSIET